jgi:hypothetical protein
VTWKGIGGAMTFSTICPTVSGVKAARLLLIYGSLYSGVFWCLPVSSGLF